EFEPLAEKVIVVLAPGGYLADPALSLSTPAPGRAPAPAGPRCKRPDDTLISSPLTGSLSGRSLRTTWTTPGPSRFHRDSHAPRLAAENLNSDKFLMSFVRLLSVYGGVLPGSYITPTLPRAMLRPT